MKRITALLLAIMMLLAFTACGEVPVTEETGNFGFQLEAPAEGEEIAIMHTNHGDIYIRLFPEHAPKTVENFKTLAKDGYYNGIIFHRVIEDFMIQGGDPTGTGMSGESYWGGTFADEFHADLGNLRGALAMANAGEDTNGSQFFINQAGPDTLGSVAGMKHIYEQQKDGALSSFETFKDYLAYRNQLRASKITDQVIKAYEEVGGNISLDGPLRDGGGHTVFGQVFNGMKVVDAIAGLPTEDGERPVNEVRIESIEFKAYTADMLTADTLRTEIK